MTDITELAQILKAAANTTADAIDRLKEFPGDELIDLSQHEGEQVDIDITTINEWYELSSPANILALVEALEKAQAKNALVAGGIEASTKLHERIAELESRTVTVKLPEVYGYLRENDGQIQISIGAERPSDRSGGYATPWFAIYTAAGIKWEAE